MWCHFKLKQLVVNIVSLNTLAHFYDTTNLERYLTLLVNVVSNCIFYAKILRRVIGETLEINFCKKTKLYHNL